MEMNIHSILSEEIAAMGGHSNRVLNEKTGCIGYLTANLNASAPVFESSWHDRTPRLNTPEFTDDFNDMMDALRQTIFYKGIMPSEKVLDFPVDCNTLTGSVNL